MDIADESVIANFSPIFIVIVNSVLFFERQ